MAVWSTCSEPERISRPKLSDQFPPGINLSARFPKFLKNSCISRRTALSRQCYDAKNTYYRVKFSWITRTSVGEKQIGGGTRNNESHGRREETEWKERTNDYERNLSATRRRYVCVRSCKSFGLSFPRLLLLLLFHAHSLEDRLNEVQKGYVQTKIRDISTTQPNP
jgi:hypothetical protein